MTGTAVTPSNETPDRRLRPVGSGEACRRLLDRTQDGEKRGSDERDGHGHERVERQVHRIERVLRGVREEGRLAEDRDEDRVGHDAREHRGDQRFGLEVVAMENLDGEEGRAEGRPEDGGHARRQTGDQQDAALPVRDAQVLADDRPNRAAHLHRGALATPRAAEAQGEDRGQALGERHPATDVAASGVERFDDRIGAPASGLGGGPRDQARPERAECRHEPDEPPPERVLSHISRDALARGAERHVPAETLEHDLLNHLDAQEEERSDEPRGDADERGPEQGASKQLDRDGAPRRQDRPSQYGPHPGRVAAPVVVAFGWGRRHR